MRAFLSPPIEASIPVRIFPSPVGTSVRDPIIKVFIRDFDTEVTPGSVRLFRDGTQLIPLVITDRSDGVEAEYRGRQLLPLGLQTVTVVYSDNDVVPVTLTNTWTFFVGPLTHDTLFIEAEDFNYSNDGVTGGLHADFGDPDCSLQGRDAVRFVDYFEVDDSNPLPVYRGPTGVETVRENADAVRAERTNSCDYVVRSIEAGDWYNYTRSFPVYDQSFYVYLRATSWAGGRVRLDRVEGVAGTNQAVTPLGTFEIIHPLGPPNNPGFYPSQVNDNTAPIRVCGPTTLRLTLVDGALDLNYLALVPASGPHERSLLGSIYPPGGDFARAPLIKVNLSDWESAVIPSSIKLFFDCMDVTAQATITDLPSGATIAYQAPVGSPLGARHDVHVRWDDTRHCGLPPNDYAWFYREGPYNPDLNLFIEAEDFDTAGGNYFPSNPATTNSFNRKGLYRGRSALHDVDYHFLPQAGTPLAYRTGLNPEVGMREAADTGVGQRPGFEAALDYRIGWNAPGNWYNYTRHWPNSGPYNIYLRASHGITNTIVNGELSMVHTNGTTQSLGTFSSPSTGNWDVFAFIPLRDSGGDLASVQLAGQRTLRYTVLPGTGAPPFAADLNYMMFVPSPPVVASPPFVGVQRCDLDDSLRLTFSGVLQSANAITGPWETVSAAVSPLVIRGTDATQKFWRVAPPE